MSKKQSNPRPPKGTIKPDPPPPPPKKIENQVIDDIRLPKKDLFRVDEVAQYFSITERTVRLWIEHGNLMAVKKGGIVRIPRKSILDCHVLGRREIL